MYINSPIVSGSIADRYNTRTVPESFSAFWKQTIWIQACIEVAFVPFSFRSKNVEIKETAFCYFKFLNNEKQAKEKSLQFFFPPHFIFVNEWM